MDLKNIKHIHFTGIKGVGMTSLALCAKDLGIRISGSDIKEFFVTDATLKKANISWSERFTPRNLSSDIDLLITTGAHGGLRNVEVLKAKKMGIPTMTQGEALAFFAKGKSTISVCGVGGKTTISSMIATIFEYAKKNPSYAIGVGEIFPLGLPGRYAKGGKDFICEADEFVVSPGIDNTPKFLLLEPFITVATNIEHDHPDVYKSFSSAKKAYLKFFKKLPNTGTLISFFGNENTLEVAKESGANLVTYGRKKGADWRIVEEERNGWKTKVTVKVGESDFSFQLNFPGKYNVENALASIIAAKLAGIELEEVLAGIEKFEGVKRRFEKIGKIKTGALLIDDYAHHPEEISSVLELTRELFPKKRIIAVFQPHTYSRTRALFNEFTKSFKDADIVGLVDIYSSAREEKDPSVSSERLANAIKKGGKYLGSLKSTTEWILENTDKDDIVLTLGAGDIFYIHEKLV